MWASWCRSFSMPLDKRTETHVQCRCGARRECQADNLVLWKMILVSRDGLDALQESILVLLNLSVTKGCVDWSTESYLSVFSFAPRQLKQVWLRSVCRRLTCSWLPNWYAVFCSCAVLAVQSAGLSEIWSTSPHLSPRRYIYIVWRSRTATCCPWWEL